MQWKHMAISTNRWITSHVRCKSTLLSKEGWHRRKLADEYGRLSKVLGDRSTVRTQNEEDLHA